MKEELKVDDLRTAAEQLPNEPDDVKFLKQAANWV